MGLESILNAAFAADAQQPDFSDGIMLCVRPDDPGRFCLEGGLPSDDMHVTLGYFGKTSEADAADQGQIQEIIGAEGFMTEGVIAGEVTAMTLFGQGDGEDAALVLLVDAPGLSDFRAKCMAALRPALSQAGQPKSNHDFMPHITLCYGPGESDLAQAEQMVGMPLQFDHVELVWGTEVSQWGLRASEEGIPEVSPDSGLRLGIDTPFDDYAQTPNPGVSKSPDAGEASPMPYEIVENSPDCEEAGKTVGVRKVGTEDILGCHASPEDAQKQIDALMAEEAPADKAPKGNAPKKGVNPFPPKKAAAEEDAEVFESSDPLAIVIGPDHGERLSAIEEFLAAAVPVEEAVEAVEMACAACTARGTACATCGGTGFAEDAACTECAAELVALGSADFKATPVHHTEASDGPWDGPANEKKVKEGEDADYYDEIYGWNDPEADPATKAAWKFIHHEVGEDGEGGAANLKACSTGIGVLNGARGGTVIPEADRQGVYEHLAAHLTDAGLEAPAYAIESGEVAEMVVEATETFRALASHHTPTTDTRDWSGDVVKTRTRSGETPAYYADIYAWFNGDESPTHKTAYKFPHHVVSESGAPGAAVDWACHAALMTIDDSVIPKEDYSGVYNHLAAHLKDAGMDVPDLGSDNASVDEVRGAIAELRSQSLQRLKAQVVEAQMDPKNLDDEELAAELIRRWVESVANRSGGSLEEALEDGEFAVPAAAPADAPAEAPDEAPAKQMGDFKKGDFEWEGVLIVEGLPSGDGRMIAQEALTWRNLPLPLMLQTQNAEGHDGAVIAGSIHEIERQGENIIGRGYFDSGTSGQEAKRLMTEGTMRGVSADIDSVVADLQDASGGEIAPEDVMMGDVQATEVLVAGRIMGATMTPFPAFQEAQLHVLGSEEQAIDPALVASGQEVQGEVWRFTSPYPMVVRDVHEPVELVSLVASATEPPSIPVNPPLAWFSLMEMDEPEPFTVYADGRCYGLVAKFGTCHIGFRDRCVNVPRTGNAYRSFRNKNTLTQEGELVATGPIFMDTVHPNLRLVASDAEAHYADTGCAVADVALYENEFGIVAAGAVRPNATPEQIRRLRGSDISPDWRMMGHHRNEKRLEIVGLLAVNVSGFIVEGLAASGAETTEFKVEQLVPRARINTVSGEVEALVAAGSVRKCSNCGTHAVDADSLTSLVEMLARHENKLNELFEAVRPIRAERMAARFTQMAIGAEASVKPEEASTEETFSDESQEEATTE